MTEKKPNEFFVAFHIDHVDGKIDLLETYRCVAFKLHAPFSISTRGGRVDTFQLTDQMFDDVMSAMVFKCTAISTKNKLGDAFYRTLRVIQKDLKQSGICKFIFRYKVWEADVVLNPRIRRDVFS